MKVITEERLADIFATRFINKETQQLLINELQELDTLTVTRLRPMSDLPQCQHVNAYRYQEGFESVYLNNYGRLLGFGGVDVEKADFEGWIPMPRYEPEKA